MTRDLWSGLPTRDPLELVGEADLHVAESRALGPGYFALRLRDPGSGIPPGLGSRIEQGYSWLELERPLGLSFVGAAIASKRTFLDPQGIRVDLTSVQNDDPVPGEVIVRVRIDGGKVPGGIDGRVRRIPDQKLEVEGLGSIPEDALRTALGRGMDAAFRICVERELRLGRWDTIGWVAVIDGKQRVVDWRMRLEEAQRTCDLAPLEGLDLVLRRYRPATEPPAIYFRVRFDLVLILSQMRAFDPHAWTWEGLWTARMVRRPAEGSRPVETGALVSRIRYRELKARGRYASKDVLGRVALTPLAVGGDLALAWLNDGWTIE